MGWVRISDDFYDHEKFADVSGLGVGVWIAGLAFANRNLTDGIVTKRALAGLVSTDRLGIFTGTLSGEDADPSHGASELVAAGLWHAAGHDCARCPQPPKSGFVIHDYLDYQPSRTQVEADREAKSEAGRKGAAIRWGKAPAIADPIAGAMANGWQKNAPNPNPKTDITNFGQNITLVTARDGDDLTEFIRDEAAKLGIKNLGRVRKAVTRCLPILADPTDAELIDLVRAVVDLSPSIVRHPEAYIERAVEQSPHEITAAWTRLARPVPERLETS